MSFSLRASTPTPSTPVSICSEDIETVPDEPEVVVQFQVGEFAEPRRNHSNNKRKREEEEEEEQKDQKELEHGLDARQYEPQDECRHIGKKQFLISVPLRFRDEFMVLLSKAEDGNLASAIELDLLGLQLGDEVNNKVLERAYAIWQEQHRAFAWVDRSEITPTFEF